MFYLVEVEDHVRVEPKLFGLATAEAVKEQLQETYSGFQDKELGTVVSVLEVLNVDEGIIIPGDGAAYYKSQFKLIVFRPELQELAYGTIDEITSFGAFINLGVIKGMIHISQTMDDYVSFSKTGSLTGKDGKRSLNKKDDCIARIVAISYKGEEPKIGLTMRQPGLGKLDWVQTEKEKSKKEAAKLAKLEEKAAKSETKKPSKSAKEKK
ncbi:DNA-directed RNA polymerase [Candidatus Pacearchaeota archaeon]|nr:DNA-directed RNA polymerase [Candidatus Pacearchaeota archaeon]|tara:strand:+ start:1530 stop:2159 length:630 start_codon:yes stop_codon:yes gene_type:complete